MGGMVVVGIRKRDGSVLAQERATNPMRYWFHDPGFLNGDDAVVDAYVGAARGGSSARCPLAPAGYGLVVLDFKSNHILSMQDYTTFGRIDPATMWMEIDPGNQESIGAVSKQIRDGRLGTADVFFRRQGRPLDGVAYFGQEMDPVSVRNLARSILDAEDTGDAERFRRIDAGDDTVTVKRFVYDLSPMELENFEDTASMRQRLVELGFTFGAAAAAAWDTSEAEEASERAQRVAA